jgi:hypothetical protein
MRAIVLVAAALVITACGSDEPATQGSGIANLTISVDRDGKDSGNVPIELKLNCASASESDACQAADAISKQDLAPTPGNQACTQIFGGPETATIKGTLHGEPVDATFSRTDGCEIERWQRVAPLLAHVT